jgi:hypothetical protein
VIVSLGDDVINLQYVEGLFVQPISQTIDSIRNPSPKKPHNLLVRFASGHNSYYRYDTREQAVDAIDELRGQML